MLCHPFQLDMAFTRPTPAYVGLPHCLVTAPPVPPSNIINVKIINTPIHPSEDGLLTFVVQWLKPRYLNGNNTIGPTYEVWIGTVHLPPMADPFNYHNQRLVYVKNIQVSDGDEAWWCIILC